MLRLKDIPPEEMPAVVRIASELYERDQALQAEAQERASVVAAAEELGLPREYLERAAVELHRRRVDGVTAGRSRRTALYVALGVAAFVLTFILFWAARFSVIERAPAPVPPPVTTPAAALFTEPFDAGAAGRWVLDKNPETAAAVQFTQNDGAVIQVRSFGSGSGSTPFFVNLDMTQAPRSLAGVHTVSFRVRGQGLPHVRFDLQSGATERWRSPTLPVTGEWRDVRVDLGQFERQTRGSATDSWRAQPFHAPGEVRRLSFKVGYFINDRGAHGDVSVRDLRIE